MNENKNIEQDNKLAELLKDSKLVASENLQYRIMQQIKTESLLAQKVEKESKGIRPMINVMITIGIIMYSIIIALGIIAYSGGGVDAIFSSTYLAPMLFVSLICSAYGLISVFDEKRFLKKKP